MSLLGLQFLLTFPSDAPAPQPAHGAYPPPANGGAAQARGPNPYANASQHPPNISMAPASAGNYNSYTAQPQGYAAPQTNQYAAQGGQPQGYGGNAGNPYAQQQYGQQDQYAGAVNGAGAGGGNDFWAELSSTNSALSTLQEEIQAVRTAHQQSLVGNLPHPKGQY